MIGSFFESLTRGMTGGSPRLSFYSARRAFRSLGWTMQRDLGAQMSMVVRVDRLGLLGFRILNEAPREVDLFHVSSWGNSRRAIGMILTDSDWPIEIQSMALARGVMILKWPDIGDVADHYQKFREARAMELAAAKKSARAALPPSDLSLSKPLSKSQILSGFLFSTGAVACWFIDRGGSDLIISFAQHGSKHGMKSRLGEAVAAAANRSVLGFETSEQNWFPADDMEQCVVAAEIVLKERFSTRMLFGSVQGGFAALRFSRRLQATSVFAISPQYSIDPHVFDDPRFRDKYDPTIHSGMHIAPSRVCGVLTLIYDPFDVIDLAHAERIAAEVRVQTIERPFAGHGCYCVLASPGETYRIIHLCGLGDIAAARRIATSQRRSDPRRAYYMAMSCCERRPETGYRLFNKYSAILPSLNWGHVCFRLAHRGFAKRVIGWVRDQAGQKSENAEAQALVALIALQASDADIAHSYISKALEIDSRSKRFLYISSLPPK